MIKDIIKTIIFFIFMSLLIWARIIRDILPKDLLNLTYEPITALITFGMILIFFLISLSVIIQKLNIKYNKKHFTIIAKLIVLLKDYFINAPDGLLSLLSKKYDFNLIFTNRFSYVVVHFYYPRIIVLLFIFFPPFFLATLFIYEILINHYIEFFYKYLIVLFIPLCTKALIYIMDQLSLGQIEYVSAHMTCKYEENTMILGLAPVSPDIPNAIPLEEMPKAHEWLVTQFEIHTTIKNFCDQINEFKNKYIAWLILYYSLLYMIGWLVFLFSLFGLPLPL